jgi:2,4-dienoyl-CoA reductase (NADPH2)
LLEPVTLAGRTAPNRILFGPHVTNLGDRRALSDRHLAYYERRAQGGCGTIVCEEASVHDSDWPYERAPLAAHCAEGWERLAGIGHDHGALVLAAIGHSGGQGSSAYSQRELWAPSGVPEVNTREVPKVMEPEDIAAVVAGFGAATALAVEAGLDGVEVNAGQHSLVRQFMSGLTNQREDGYGADRLRFVTEVLGEVRAAVAGRILGLRLSCDELAPWAGITPEAAADIARTLAPLVDYLVVVRGSIFSVSATRPDMHTPPGFNLDLAGAIRAAVGGVAAVVAQGSIVDVGQAEWAIGDGRADLVEMTRAQIADPDLAAKAATDPALIRPCPLSNQRDQVRDGRNPIVTSEVEPRSGHETIDPDPGPDGAAATRPSRPLDILVVGGGVAGLECARVAAARGHRVELVERTGELGGVLRDAAAGAGRERFDLFVDWLVAECRRLGVAVETGRTVTPDGVAAEARPVVLCTGGRDGTVDYEVADGAICRTALDVLAARRRGAEDAGLPGGPVAVWDPIGGTWAISVAELLAGAGRAVTLVTPDLIAGSQLGLTGDLAPASTRLQAAGVALVKRATVRAARPGAVEVEDRFTGAVTSIEAAALVDAGHRLPDDTPWGPGNGAVSPIRVGDAVAPRSVHEAVLEARRAVFALEDRG